MSAPAPRVSIIVPTYNCADILGGCLDSLVAQDYANLEITIIDGGSSDRTVAVARGYGGRIARIISEPDRGIYDAMNKGIMASSGEWLYFIGADDSLADASVVSTMMSSLAAQDDSTLLLYGDVNNLRTGARYRGLTELPVIVSSNICHQAIFYRRRLFELESPYDLRYRLYADWDLNLRVFLRHPGTHRFVDHVVANYTGGASWFVRDEVFDAELERNVWHYANTSSAKDGGRWVRARLYVRSIRSALKRREPLEALRLLAVAPWRSSFIRLIGWKIFGQ